ncbi:MAG: nucleotidyltransferase domain-containing protein [Thermodesulfobacteriota bacterium]
MNVEIADFIERAVATLKAAGAKEIYLFGSMADGEASDVSDVDLAVSGLPPERFYQAMSEAAEVLQRPLDLVDLDEDNLFTCYLKKKGKLRRVG